MKRSNAEKHTKPRFGRHGYNIGARQGGADIRQERARLIAIIAQQSGSEPGRMRIMARRMAQGKRV